MPATRFLSSPAGAIRVAAKPAHGLTPATTGRPATQLELANLSRMEHEILAREGAYEVDTRRFTMAKGLARLPARVA